MLTIAVFVHELLVAFISFLGPLRLPGNKHITFYLSKSSFNFYAKISRGVLFSSVITVYFVFFIVVWNSLLFFKFKRENVDFNSQEVMRFETYFVFITVLLCNCDHDYFPINVRSR